MKIGVFDSGIGGRVIAESLETYFPSAEIIYASDKEHMPYGKRVQSEIIQLTDNAIKPLLDARCDCIVIACNTATAAAIEYLRATYPTQLFIGLEPMVKPAALLTKSNTIAILATPYTLHSTRYQSLKDTYAQAITVIEPDCSNWASMIEDSEIDNDRIEATIRSVLAQGADVIVLACTHYHWIKETILEIADGNAIVIDPSDAINRRVASLLSVER